MGIKRYADHVDGEVTKKARNYLHSALLTVICITDARSPTDDAPMNVEESHDASKECL